MEDGVPARSQRGRRGPRYEGEDLSPTTNLELRGFYAYGLAAEVFAVCGIGMKSQSLLKGCIANCCGRLICSRDFGAAGKGRRSSLV
jgi:hypothetical protein